MKKILLAAVAASAMTVSAELKFATVDMAVLIRNHPDYERNEKLLDSTDKDYQKKVDAIKGEGEALQTEGRKLLEQLNNPMLNEKAKSDLKKNITDIQQKLLSIEQRYRAESMRCNQDLHELRQRLLKSVASDIKKRVETFAKAKGYDLVLDSNAAAYASGQLDVTFSVLSDMGVDPSKAKGADEGK